MAGGVPAGRLSIEIVAEIARLQKDLDAAKRQVAAASRDIGRSAQSANDNIARMGTTMGGVNRASRAMQANFLNLSRQGADVATMFAMGAPPMQIFASQGLQIVDVLAMMRSEAKATGTSLTSMAAGGLARIGPYALAAAGAGGVLAAAFGEVTDRINETSDVTVSWQDVALGTFDLLVAKISGAVTDAFAALGIDVGAVWDAIVSGVIATGNMLIGTFVGSQRAILAAWQVFPGALGDLVIGGVNAAIQAIEGLVNGAISGVNAFSDRVDATLGTDLLGTIGGVDIPTITNRWAGQFGAAGGTVAGAFTSGFGDYFADFADEVSPFAQARARQRLAGDAQEAGRGAGRSLGRAAAREIEREIAEAMRAAKEAAVDAASAESDRIDKLKGWADNLERKREAELAVLEEVSERERQLLRETAEIAEQGLRNLISAIGGSGAAGSVIGTLLGITSGNISSIGGPLGELLNITTGTTTGRDGEVIARTLGDEMREIFKLEGQFGKTMTSLLQGAGTGSLVAASIFGKQDTGEAIGSAIGGAAGQAFGTAIGGPLGGQLGAIIGGSIGNAIGGLFTKSKYGTATLTGAGDPAIAARGSGRADGAAGLAGQVQNALQDVADLLGGTVGGYNLSIGTYKDSFRVSPGGKTGKLKGGDVKDFGDDSTAAVAFAIADAIRDGAIDGVSDGVAQLIGNGGDLQRQIDKAVKFQSVFDMLLEATDPAAYALKQITDQFGEFRKIFDEAGASAAEYADLEKLLALKRQEAIEAARQAKLDEFADAFSLQVRLLELMGKGEQALTAARVLEIAGMKAALQPLQALVYELEDARAVIDQFAPLAEGLREFKRELAGGGGSGSFAAAAARFRATAADAAVGDAAALGAFRSDASAFLEAAKANAASALEYNRALGEVLAGTDQGIFAAETQVEMAQLQINATIAQTDVIASMGEKLATLGLETASNTGALLRLLQRAEGEGLLIRTEAASPLAVTTA